MKTPLIVAALMTSAFGTWALANSTPAPSTVRFKGMVQRRALNDQNVKVTQTFKVDIKTQNKGLKFKFKEKTKMRTAVRPNTVREVIKIKVKARSSS
jgi:hypothetical protein